MPEPTPERAATNERLAALESGLRHLRETMDSRDQAVWRYMAELKALTLDQGKEAEKMASTLTQSIEGLRSMAWRMLQSLASALLVMVFVIAFKKLGLY